MSKLDLSKFKKVRSGEKHTVLRHPSGHEITVFHSKLGPELKQSLDKLPMMAEGGEVEENDSFAPIKKAFQNAFKKPEPTPTPGPTREEQYQKTRERNANQFGSNYADGGTPTPQPTQDPRQAAQDSMRKAFHFKSGGAPIVGDEQQVQASPLEAQYAAENSAAADPQVSSDPRMSEGEQWAKDIGNEMSQEAPIAPEDNSHAHLAEAVKNLSQKFIGVTPQPAAPQQDVQQPSQLGSEQAPQQVQDPGAPQGSFAQQAVKDVNVANQAENAAAGNIQQAQAQNAETYGHQSEQMQQLHHKYEEIGNHIHQKYEDLSDQVAKGHIDPNHWWSSKSTGSQILTAIGMMFAGAGGGASGHPEMAQQAINTAIDRDIDSQKHDLQNKNTLLGKYMEMYNSLPQAEAAARVTMQAATEGLINQHAAKLGSANAMNTATMANAQRRQQLLPQMEGLAKGQAMSNMYESMGKPSGPIGDAEAAHQKMLSDLAILNPERYKIEEAKYLPGIGVSSKPMPEKVVDEITARKDLSEKLAELENFSREHSGTTLDRKIVNQGAALARNVQDAYRRGNAQGVFKESEKNFVEKSISSDPTEYFAKIRTIPGYQTVRKMNDDTIGHYQKAYGVTPFSSSNRQQSGGQNQEAMDWLKANPNDPRAAAVKQKLGL